ncbi:MAG: hypothetical protein ACRC7N_17160 [Clostridium sp.]
MKIKIMFKNGLTKFYSSSEFNTELDGDILLDTISTIIQHNSGGSFELIDLEDNSKTIVNLAEIATIGVIHNKED